MTERCTEVRVWQVTIVCDTCDVPLRCTGRVHDTLSPQYLHVCPQCHAESALAQVSPFLRYAPREEDAP
jgi:hypothetical protein